MATQNETTDHKHGEMDISEHQKTFAGFIRMAIWVSGISIGVLIFMALVNA